MNEYMYLHSHLLRIEPNDCMHLNVPNDIYSPNVVVQNGGIVCIETVVATTSRVPVYSGCNGSEHTSIYTVTLRMATSPQVEG